MAGVLNDVAVLVTGGGTGIGAASALRLAKDGANVTICGRTEASLEGVVTRGRSDGLSLRYVIADVTNEDDIQRAVDAARNPGGDLHGVVANAGGGGGMGPYHRLDAEEFLRVLSLNVLGTMLLVKHSVPHLVQSGGGSFVGMSSIAAHLTHPYFGAYPVAKAGIEAIVRNAADEFGGGNVRFNAVRPGFTSTEIMEGIPRDSAVFKSYIDNTPLNGVAEPEDVAELVRFLIGPESRWITGECIGVDGGQGLRRGPDFTSFIEPVIGPEALQARGPVRGQ